eukprot:scaffold1172_cov180-Ochromonas_danica.AAC.32
MKWTRRGHELSVLSPYFLNKKEMKRKSLFIAFSFLQGKVIEVSTDVLSSTGRFTGDSDSDSDNSVVTAVSTGYSNNGSDRGSVSVPVVSTGGSDSDSSSGTTGSSSDIGSGTGRSGQSRRRWTAEEDLQLKKGIQELGQRWNDLAKRYFPYRKGRERARREGECVIEDVKLVELVKKKNYDSSWSKIAAEMNGRNAHRCYERWCYYLDPTLDLSEWKIEEDEILTTIILQDINHHHLNHQSSYWKDVASLLPTKRSIRALRYHFTSLKKKLLSSSSSTSSTTIKKKKRKKVLWTREEDDELLQAVHQHGTRDWNVIASYLPQRNKSQCLDRYYRLLKKDDGIITRGSLWGKQEDEELVQAVKEFGDSGRWASVANALYSSKTAKECKVRWRQLSRRLNKTPWTKEEDDLLVYMRQQKKIGCDSLFHHFKGRSLTAISQRCEELGVGNSRKPWSKEEMDLLIKLVSEKKATNKPISWKSITDLMPTKRTKRAYCNYYYKWIRIEGKRENVVIQSLITTSTTSTAALNVVVLYVVISSSSSFLIQYLSIPSKKKE